MSRVWTLRIEAPCPWLTANRLPTNRNQLSRLVRLWRTAVLEACHENALPVRLNRIEVKAEARFLGRPPVRDRANLAPTLKACIDGLGPGRTYERQGKTVQAKGYGLIVDDDDKHLTDSGIRIGAPLSPHVYRPGHPGLLVMTITEIGGNT